MTALMQYIRLEMCSRRNTLIKVNNLPTEVLCQIFLAVGSNIKDKIALSQTCSHWRNVSIKFPFMWTSLNLNSMTHQNIVPLVMQRSDGFALQMKCTNWNSLRHTLCALELYRVKELDISLSTYGHDLYHDWLQVRPAPQLTQLSISCNAEVTIPPIFAGQHPRLTELHLFECRMAFSPGIYRGLKILTIESVVLPDSKHGNDVDIMHVFKDCPELEEIVLEGCSLTDEDPFVEAHGIIHLRHLRTMQLGLEARCIRRILQLIDAPPTVHLKLHFYTDFNEPGDKYPISEPNNIMVSLFNKFRSFVVHGPRLEVFGFNDREMRQPSFEASFDTDDYARISRVISPISKFLPMPNLQRLQVHRIPDEDVVTLLKHAPTVTRLDIRCEEEVREIEELTRGMHPTGVIRHLVQTVLKTPQPLFPRLRTLSLDSAFLDMDTIFALGELCQLCRRLRHLSLHRCNSDLGVAETQHMLLQEYETVEWTESQDALTFPGQILHSKLFGIFHPDPDTDPIPT